MNNLHYTISTSNLNRGLWDAENNIPNLTLIDETDSGNAGAFWTVSTDGTTDISALGLDDITSVDQGDQLTILNGEWTKQSAGISESLVDAKITNIFSGATEGQVLKKGSGNNVIDSSIDDSGSETEFDKTISVPPSSVNIGYDVTLSDAGGNLIYDVNSLDVKRIPITVGFDDTGTTEQPFTTEFEALESDVAWQGIYTETLNNTVFDFTRTTTASEFLYDCKFKIGATAPTSAVVFCAYRGTTVDSTKLLLKQTISPENFTANSDYVLTLSPPLGFYEGEPVHFYIESATAFDFLGSATTPYLAVDRQVGVFTRLATVDDIPVFGTEFQKFESMDESTSGYSWTDKLDVTTTILPAGTYRIGFNCEVTEDNNSQEIRFLVDGSSIHNHSTGNDELEPYVNDENWTTLNSVYYKTLSTADTIELGIQHKDSGSGKISNAIIEVWRVS